MKLGERLRLIRKQHKLTLKDLKERSDLSVPYLSDIERGVVNPSIDTLQKVAKAYAMTVQELITGLMRLANRRVKPILKDSQNSCPTLITKMRLMMIGRNS